MQQSEREPEATSSPQAARDPSRRHFVRRTAAVAGGVVAAGYVRPTMFPIGVARALAISGPGPQPPGSLPPPPTGRPFASGTPGMWSGAGGGPGSPYVRMWGSLNDPDWTGVHAPNPFAHGTEFNTYFEPSPTLRDERASTMLELVNGGGSSLWPTKVARDVVAAYLNASYFGTGYPFTRDAITTWWRDAIRSFHNLGSTGPLETLHTKLDAANNGT